MRVCKGSTAKSGLSAVAYVIMVLFFRETDLDRVGQEGTKKEGGGGGKAVRCYKMCPSPPSLSPSSLPLRSGLWPLGIESQTKTLMGPQLIAVRKEREGGRATTQLLTYLCWRFSFPGRGRRKPSALRVRTSRISSRGNIRHDHKVRQ